MNNLGSPVKNNSRVVLSFACLGVLTLIAAACGGGPNVKSAGAGATTTTTATASTATSAPAGNKGTTRPGGGGPSNFAPAATGTIASISGQTLEVQNPQSGQTTVNVTSKTVMSGTVSASLSEIKVGSCVSTTGTKVATGGIDATTVVISSAVKGKCGLGGGGFGGGGFGGRGFGSRPGGFFGSGSGRTPSSFPARTGSSLPANFSIATGKVTAISGSKLTVQAIAFSPITRSTTTTTPGGSTVNPARKTSPETVIVSPSTKYSKQERLTVSGLKDGESATAFGSTNDIGAVTATRLTVSPATATGCSTGFSGFGRGGFGGGGAGAPS